MRNYVKKIAGFFGDTGEDWEKRLGREYDVLSGVFTTFHPAVVVNNALHCAAFAAFHHIQHPPHIKTAILQDIKNFHYSINTSKQ